jgi:hypothetical protein
LFKILKKLIQKIENKKNLQKRLEKISFKIVNRPSGADKKLIWVLPALNYPCGGNIVGHNYVDTINALQYKGFKSEVLYSQLLDFKPTLFKYSSELKTDLTVDPKKEFFVIPEVLALSNAVSLAEQNIPYAISVLNGYLMDMEVNIGIGDFNQLEHVYEKAAFIISVSEDTTANIKLAFPKCANKIIQASYVIDKAKMLPIVEKQNIITYMPRKLGRHSQLILLLLGNKLPKNWEVMPIDGVSEQAVYDIFTKSKIFLSVSEFEGLAMPPVMAALSGNLVIGYTGEGNKEYFHLPCFEEVMQGDIKDFVEKLLEAVKRYDNDQVTIDMPSIEFLKNKFSEHALSSFLKNMLDHVDDAYR